MAEKALASKGIEHLSWVRHLRKYIAGKPEFDIIEEIKTITNKDIFGVMIEVGLNDRLMEALTEKWSSMT